MLTHPEQSDEILSMKIYQIFDWNILMSDIKKQIFTNIANKCIFTWAKVK